VLITTKIATNLAGLYALQTSLGSVWAAIVVAIADLAPAAIVILAATHCKPGAEIVLADDARKIAIEAVQADAAGSTSSRQPLANAGASAQKVGEVVGTHGYWQTRFLAYPMARKAFMAAPGRQLSGTVFHMRGFPFPSSPEY
jgi:hypothetical protein